MTRFIRRRLLLKSGLPTLSALAIAVSLMPAQAAAGPVKLALVESLSGPFANTGEAVFRNLVWAVERVNQRGGIRTAQGPRLLRLARYDSKGQTEEALSTLRAAIDDGAQIILQGNSSATAAALIDAIGKHNDRDPARRVLFLNYSAVEPALTNEKCSFWHFRFDAHADMRMAALMSVLKEDASVKQAYLIGQDYSFGQAVLREARRQLGAQRPDIQVVGDELHPVGRVKDFLPYLAKIKASGAQAVITGNWGNDLTLLVKAAKDVGYEGKFYTFYGNALGAPAAAIGEAGIGKVIAVADWLPNLPTKESQAFYQAFRQRFPKPTDDYVHMRMQLMVELLAQALEKAGAESKPESAIDMVAASAYLEIGKATLFGQSASMRAADHQVQQSLVVGVMDRQGSAGVPFDVEGSGFGFRVIKTLSASQAELPTTCKMSRPG
ncbi:MAG: branched-chain amino acid ABC transporter substrate-binding protein [Betaproteobacteria bacterium]|nr:branched-chain amino acid ABC transporter substrate-binding protein [Betaproteobacteria bacterium]